MAEIIVVDDEIDVRRMLHEYLSLAGHGVRQAESGDELRLLLEEAAADLVVLDLNLPSESGLRIARRLREHHDLGIVMLTAAQSPVDRIVGLEIGADDYVTKPFDLAELAARIEAVLRRRRPPVDPSALGLLPFGSYVFDSKGFRLLDAEGTEVKLAPMEVDLVAAFATNPGRVLGREDLLRLAPPRGEDSFDRSIDNRVARLRRKLERQPTKPELIRTVRGGGYLFKPTQAG